MYTNWLKIVVTNHNLRYIPTFMHYTNSVSSRMYMNIGIRKIGTLKSSEFHIHLTRFVLVLGRHMQNCDAPFVVQKLIESSLYARICL